MWLLISVKLQYWGGERARIFLENKGLVAERMYYKKNQIETPFK